MAEIENTGSGVPDQLPATEQLPAGSETAAAAADVNAALQTSSAAATTEDHGLLPMDDPMSNSNGASPDEPTSGPPSSEAVEAALNIAQAARKQFWPREPALQVVQEFETFQPLIGGELNGLEPILPLAADTFERTREMLDATPNIDITKSPGGDQWALIFNEGQRSQLRGDYLQRTVNRPPEQASFRQTVQSEHGPLGAMAPRVGEDTQGYKAVGEAAVMRVRASLGLGTSVAVPLWHSGFWVTFKAPGDGEFLELHRRLTEDKINLGRQSWGLAFANNSVFFAGSVMDFALAHVLETSLKDTDLNVVRSKINTLDIPILAWGLACTIWPKGFQYSRAIPDLQGGQTRQINERLNLAKLLWVDTKSLTPWQIAHMARRHGRQVTTEQLERYKSEFTRGQGRTVELRPNLKLALKVPSMDEYLNNGQLWVNNIVAMADKAFDLSRDNEQRDNYIFAQGKATNFRQYGHWVESIESSGMVITDPNTMSDIFDVLSADDEIRAKFFTAVKEFMEDAMVALVAVPTFDPEEQKKALPRHPHLLPLDVISTFFTLLVQRVQRVMDRE